MTLRNISVQLRENVLNHWRIFVAFPLLGMLALVLTVSPAYAAPLPHGSGHATHTRTATHTSTSSDTSASPSKPAHAAEMARPAHPAVVAVAAAGTTNRGTFAVAGAAVIPAMPHTGADPMGHALP